MFVMSSSSGAADEALTTGKQNKQTFCQFSRILRLSSDGSGPKPFWRALGPTLGEWLKPGPGPGPWLKA